MKRLVKGEKGYVLIAALIVLLVLGLISGPLLSYMVGGLRAGHVFETGAGELYAADAGVQDAVLRIPSLGLGFGPTCRNATYTISDVNGRNVTVIVELQDDGTYKVTSTAVTKAGGDTGNTADLGSVTQIEAYVEATPKYYPSIVDQLITIQGDITDVKQLENELAKLGISCPSGCSDCGICGKAYDYAVYDSIPVECRGCVAVYNFPATAWPTAGGLSSTYWQDVQNGVAYGPSVELTDGDVTLEKGYRLGKLSVTSSDNKNTDTLTLNGNLYVRDEAEIGNTGNGEFILDLGGKTLFVASNVTGGGASGTALTIGGKCQVKGPGAIIAVGDVKFQPKSVLGDPQNPVLILSVSGTTTVAPSGEMYGAIAGKIDVDVGSGSTPTVTFPIDGFPDSIFPRIQAGTIYSITSWEVSRLQE